MSEANKGRQQRQQQRQPYRLREDLLADMPRGQSKNHIGAPAHAYFESPENMLATPSMRFEPVHNRAAKDFLGVLGGEITLGARQSNGVVPHWISGGTPIGWADDRHILTIAGSRSGKGRRNILTNILLASFRTSMFILDPKGENCRISARYRALGQQVVALDPFQCGGPVANGLGGSICPIAYIRNSSPDLITANAKLCADALIIPGNLKEPHWDQCATAMLAALMILVAFHPLYEGRRTLVTVWRLASELIEPDPADPRQYRLERLMMDTDLADGAVRLAALNFYGRASNEFSSVHSNLTKHLDWISMRAMWRVLEGPAVDLRALKTSSLCVYLIMPGMRMSYLSPWVRMCFQLALASCEEVQVNDGRQVRFVLDEAHILGGLPQVEMAMAQLAGMGVKLIIYAQNLGQLKKNFKENYEIFIANAGLIQVFGLAEKSSCEYVSQMLGSSAVLTRSSNAPTFEQASRQAASGESWSVSQHPLLNAAEVKEMFRREDRHCRQLILRPGAPPAVVQSAYYDKHELFRGRFDE